MKKTLVALAALAATSAFAQSSVTLSGNIDFAAATISGSQLWAKGTTVSTGVGTASTSVINLVAEETLKGGIKITAKYGLDPRSLANDSLAVTNNTGVVSNLGAQSATYCAGVAVTATSGVCAVGTVSGQANTATGLARDEVFVGISGGMGNLRLGSPNSIGLNSFQVASPLGTGVGSGYTGASTSGTMTNSFVQTRYNRSVRYDSPSINGITASVLYAPGNDIAQPTTTATQGSSGLVTPSVPVASLIPNARQATEFGLRYAAGPVTVSYAYVTQDAQANSTGWYASGTATKGNKTAVNMLNASFAMGATTLYAGWNNGNRLAHGLASSSDLAAVDTKGYRLGVKHDMGAMSLLASYTTQEANGITSISGTAGSSNTANVTGLMKATVMGLRGDYNLSKTAAVYVGYEKYDTGAAFDVKAQTTTGDRSVVSLGLRKSF